MYDVAIVGASVAGCAAAIMLARKGIKVVLLDRKADAQSYKRVCTHYLQPSSVPTIERLGLMPLLNTAGASHPLLEIWTPWGWIVEDDRDVSPGISIRREKLDPILVGLAGDTAGVDVRLGHTLRSVVREGGRATGVVTTDKAGVEHRINVKLVVGADGRQSRTAESAKLRTRQFKNQRSAFYCYFSNLELSKPGVAQAWYANPNVASIFPTDNNVTMVSVMPKIENESEWSSDREGKLISLVESMPGAPSLRNAQRISPILGMADMPVIWRKSSDLGLALIGDAAFAADPIWGVGCGWAFQSAEWLVDCVAGNLQNAKALDGALKRYSRLHRWRLGGHALHMVNYASGRKFYAMEKFLFSAASKGGFCANRVHAYGHRKIGITGLMNPNLFFHAIRAHLSGSPITIS